MKKITSSIKEKQKPSSTYSTVNHPSPSSAFDQSIAVTPSSKVQSKTHKKSSLSSQFLKKAVSTNSVKGVGGGGLIHRNGSPTSRLTGVGERLNNADKRAITPSQSIKTRSSSCLYRPGSAMNSIHTTPQSTVASRLRERESEYMKQVRQKDIQITRLNDRINSLSKKLIENKKHIALNNKAIEINSYNNNSIDTSPDCNSTLLVEQLSKEKLHLDKHLQNIRDTLISSTENKTEDGVGIDINQYVMLTNTVEQLKKSIKSTTQAQVHILKQLDEQIMLSDTLSRNITCKEREFSVVETKLNCERSKIQDLTEENEQLKIKVDCLVDKSCQDGESLKELKDQLSKVNEEKCEFEEEIVKLRSQVAAISVEKMQIKRSTKDNDLNTEGGRSGNEKTLTCYKCKDIETMITDDGKSKQELDFENNHDEEKEDQPSSENDSLIVNIDGSGGGLQLIIHQHSNTIPYDTFSVNDENERIENNNEGAKDLQMITSELNCKDQTGDVSKDFGSNICQVKRRVTNKLLREGEYLVNVKPMTIETSDQEDTKFIEATTLYGQIVRLSVDEVSLLTESQCDSFINELQQYLETLEYENTSEIGVIVSNNTNPFYNLSKKVVWQRMIEDENIIELSWSNLNKSDDDHFYLVHIDNVPVMSMSNLNSSDKMSAQLSVPEHSSASTYIHITLEAKERNISGEVSPYSSESESASGTSLQFAVEVTAQSSVSGENSDESGVLDHLLVKHVEINEIERKSVKVKWRPANTNLPHIIEVNGEMIGKIEPGQFEAILHNLEEHTKYQLAIYPKIFVISGDDKPKPRGEMVVPRCYSAFQTLSVSSTLQDFNPSPIQLNNRLMKSTPIGGGIAIPYAIGSPSPSSSSHYALTDVLMTSSELSDIAEESDEYDDELKNVHSFENKTEKVGTLSEVPKEEIELSEKQDHQTRNYTDIETEQAPEETKNLFLTNKQHVTITNIVNIEPDYDADEVTKPRSPVANEDPVPICSTKKSENIFWSDDKSVAIINVNSSSARVDMNDGVPTDGMMRNDNSHLRESSTESVISFTQDDNTNASTSPVMFHHSQHRSNNRKIDGGEDGITAWNDGFVDEEIIDDDDERKNIKRGNKFRLFVALFDYEPTVMSPNVDCCDEELAFREGQLLRVIGDQDEDGFYYGQCEDKVGYIPSNMITEVHHIDYSINNNKRFSVSAASDTKKSDKGSNNVNKKSSSKDVVKNSSKIDLLVSDQNQNIGIGVINKLTEPPCEDHEKQMLALYDYNPKEFSPNTDAFEDELTFRAGDLITVYGEVDEDGYYDGQICVPIIDNNNLNLKQKEGEEGLQDRGNIIPLRSSGDDCHGRRGLVPSNFLAPLFNNNPSTTASNKKSTSIDTKQTKKNKTFKAKEVNELTI